MDADKKEALAGDIGRLLNKHRIRSFVAIVCRKDETLVFGDGNQEENKAVIERGLSACGDFDGQVTYRVTKDTVKKEIT